MKDKIVLVLKILGCLFVFVAVGYDLLAKEPADTVYWVGLIVGIVLIIAARIIGSVNSGGDNEDKQ